PPLRTPSSPPASLSPPPTALFLSCPPPRATTAPTLPDPSSAAFWPAFYARADASLARMHAAYVESGLAAYVALEHAGLARDVDVVLPWAHDGAAATLGSLQSFSC
ncbi:hypothetical protein K488DRAFT_92641, partial [Vararia minispora EC-137]